jgi:uncharacterized membrane protein
VRDNIGASQQFFIWHHLKLVQIITLKHIFNMNIKSVVFSTRSTGLSRVSLFLLVCLWAFTLLIYAQLPDKIVKHIGFNGQIDAWGGKHNIFIMPVLALCSFLLLNWMISRPEKLNYAKKITPENAEAEYAGGVFMLEILHLVVMLTSILVTVNMALVSMDTMNNLFTKNIILFIFITVLLLGLIVYYKKRL